MLCEGAVVLVKALRTDGRIMWAKGKKGQPHTMSPFLDALQSRITGTDTHTDPSPDAPPVEPQDRPGRDALPPRPADALASLVSELVESRRRDRGGHPRDRRDRRQRRR
jgi:hypothetical protein